MQVVLPHEQVCRKLCHSAIGCYGLLIFIFEEAFIGHRWSLFLHQTAKQ